MPQRPDEKIVAQDKRPKKVPPIKPTTPFGHVAFGKDGSANWRIQKLPADKAGQEHRVAELFSAHMSDLGGEVSFEPLHEDNHDFLILVDQKPFATVQCIEIVARDFVGDETSLSSELWPTVERPGIISGSRPIDISKRDAVLTSKISKKLAKHYAKPKNMELWLLIWSVTGYFAFGEYVQGGRRVVPETVQHARRFLAAQGAEPFARVYEFNMETRPTLIWPA